MNFRQARTVIFLAAICALTLTSFQNCSPAFKAISSNMLGSSTQSSVVGSNGDVPPAVSFSLSANNVTPGTSVTINVTATAQVETATIQQVDIYVGGNDVTTLKTAPYQYMLTEQTQGPYSIYVTATDSLGGVTKTASQMLTVAASTGGGGTLAQQCESASYQAPSWSTSQQTSFSYDMNLPPDTTSQTESLTFSSGFAVTNIQSKTSDKNLTITTNATKQTLTIAPANGAECANGTATVTLQLQDQCAGVSGFTFPASASKTFTITYQNTCPAEDQLYPDTSSAYPILQQQETDGADPGMGSSVASDGNVVVMAAPGYDNGAFESGAAYVYSYANPSNTNIYSATPLSPTSRGQSISAVDVANGTIVLGTAASATSSGAVFVYKGSGTSWSLTATIPQPSPAGQTDPLLFGSAVKILSNGDIAVGAPGLDLNGNPQVGAVYVYSGTSYSQVAMLTAPTAVPLGVFGTSLATSGNYLIVGAPFSSAFESKGTSYVGSVYVYNGISGTPQQISVNGAGSFTKANATDVYQFGQAVATDGNYIAVGAPLASVNKVSSSGGAVYLFNMTGSLISNEFTTGQSSNMTASGDKFGASVAIANGVLWAGAPGNTSNTGAVFKFSNLTSSSPAKPDFVLEARSAFSQGQTYFGSSLALVGSNIAVGSPGFTINTGSTTYPDAGIGFVIQQP